MTSTLPIPTFSEALARAQSSPAKRLAADGDSDLTGFGSIDAFGRPGDEFVLTNTLLQYLNYGIFAVGDGATAPALTFLAAHCDAKNVCLDGLDATLHLRLTLGKHSSGRAVPLVMATFWTLRVVVNDDVLGWRSVQFRV
ncbi:hypothetical protein BDZ89DRAFT_1051426 [Hymenopellis radicata]|nr:hypothetical protein BDZ89DRAFT_1051426 [Hymenopellis radicata]